VKTACQCLIRIEETQARNQPGEGAHNIVQTEHSFNRKNTALREQRKQVVFTTVAPFSAWIAPLQGKPAADGANH
jgi:hypothetical protein